MLAVKRRLGIPILLTALFLITAASLFLRSGVTTTLKKITVLGGGIWHEEDKELEFTNGVQLVVFGDSWADSTIGVDDEAKGRSWTTILCQELNCTSLLNFAKSAAPSNTTLYPPTGVVTSTKLIQDATIKGRLPAVNLTLSDLSTQVQTYLSSPKVKYSPTETIFVVSLGFWDIYHAASHDYAASPRLIDALVASMFTQLDTLYTHFQTNFPQLQVPQNSTNPSPKFRIIIPKVLDPSISPGWQTQRPIPMSPNNVAEEQKNAVHLTNRWNLAVENSLSTWLIPPSSIQHDEERHADASKGTTQTIEKDAFYYDMSEYIINEIVERSMQIEGLSDAHGRGTRDSLYDDVYLACVSDEEDVSRSDYENGTVDGMMVCKSPKDFLWWDGWRLGSVANEQVGRRIGQMVRSGDSLGRAWREEGKDGFV